MSATTDSATTAAIMVTAVAGPEPEEQLPEDSRGRQRDADACDEAGSEYGNDIAHHQSQNRARLRSQRHADAELGLPLRHQIAERAVKTNHRQQQCQGAKEAGKQRQHALLNHRIVHLFGQSVKFERNLLIHAPHGGLHRRDQGRRPNARTQLEGFIFGVPRNLRDREECDGRSFLA